MRSMIGYAAIAVATLFAGAMPASANWTCDGPAYVCGSGDSASASASKVSYKKTAKSGSTSYKVAHKKKSGGESYADGGSSYSGKASYYSEPQRVASGGWFNPNALTAAHKTLPFGTKVRVTNRNNGQSVVVTINDRGPYVAGRVIDLSRAAARAINMTGAGVAPISMTVLGRG